MLIQVAWFNRVTGESGEHLTHDPADAQAVEDYRQGQGCDTNRVILSVEIGEALDRLRVRVLVEA